MQASFRLRAWRLRHRTPGRKDDRACSACAPGTVSTSINAVSCTPCPAGEVQVQPGQTQCNLWTDCGPGSKDISIESPTSSVDRICADCPSGSFSTGVNQEDCDSCTDGLTYQSRPGQITCDPVQTCAPGWYVTAEATLISNRQCTACAPGWISSESNAEACHECDGVNEYASADRTVCIPVTTCQPGERVVADPSNVEDRQCAPCEAGTVSSQANMQACIPCDGVTGYYPTSGGILCLPVSASCSADETEVG